jgi:hypothetical protein
MNRKRSLRAFILLCVVCCLFTLGALAGEGNSVKIIPDSTNTFAQFEISRIRKSIYKIKFTNEKGQVLDQLKEEIIESPKLIAFNWKGLQPGIYFVTLENKHEELKLMFIKKGEAADPAITERHQ